MDAIREAPFLKLVMVTARCYGYGWAPNAMPRFLVGIDVFEQRARRLYLRMSGLTDAGDQTSVRFMNG